MEDLAQGHRRLTQDLQPGAEWRDYGSLSFSTQAMFWAAGLERGQGEKLTWQEGLSPGSGCLWLEIRCQGGIMLNP